MKSNEKESTLTSSEDGKKESTATSAEDNNIVNLTADDDDKSTASMDSMEHMMSAELGATTCITTNIPNKDVILMYSGLLGDRNDITFQLDSKCKGLSLSAMERVLEHARKG